MSVPACQVERFCVLRLRWDRWIFQEVNNELHLVLIQPQVGHVYVLVFLEQCHGNWVLFNQHLVRSGTLTLEPGVIANLGYSNQVRTDLVAMTNGVARGAMPGKQITAVFLDYRSVGIAAHRSCTITLPAVEPVANHDGHKAGMVSGCVQHPLMGGLIPNQDAWLVAVTVVGIRIGVKAEFLGN